MQVFYRRLRVAILYFLLMTLLPAAVFAGKPPSSARSGSTDQTQAEIRSVTQLIVKLRARETHAAALTGETMAQLKASSGAELSYLRRMAGGAHVLKLPERLFLASAEEMASRLRSNPSVEYVVPDRILQPAAIPNDPRFSEQWHYGEPDVAAGGVNLPGAWDITTGSATIVVAVLDTGLLPHADIDTDILDNTGRAVPGYDFITPPSFAVDGDGRDSDPTDPGDYSASGECGSSADSSWHGTHVAGTIGALGNNAVGVAGVNWVSKIQPIRVLGKCGGFTSDIIDGMYWAAGLPVPDVTDNPTPARVLNLSLGGSGPCSIAEQEAVDAAVAAGSIVVVAAGNSAGDASQFTPASCSNVITVHANDGMGQRAWYSNDGSAVEISAPGGDFGVDTGVLSTADAGTTTALNDGSFRAYNGTSMAAPHVAGIVSLMLSKNRYLTPADVLSIIQSTARAFPQYGNADDCNTTDCGAGIIDAAAALAAVPDVTPDAFSFTDQTGVEPSATATANAVAISGIDAPAPVSVSGGEYSIGCGANFTSTSGSISNGQTVCVRHTASSTFSSASSTVLTIGDVSDTFSSTTRPIDLTPDAFVFTDQTGMEPSAVVTSDAVTLSGIDASVSVSISGGEYSIGCGGSFTASSGTIDNGQTVCVRHTASSTFSGTTHTILTVGGVSDTFSSTTKAAPPPRGGGGGGALTWASLLPLLPVLGRRRHCRTAG